MFKRPKPGEDEDDILRMQEEFLKAKQNENVQPAAAVTNLRPQCTNTLNSTETGPKLSKYAQAKGLKGQREKRARTQIPEDVVMSDILEKNVFEPEKVVPESNNDNVYYPKVIASVLGDIVEKNTDDYVNFVVEKGMPSKGFPVATKQSKIFCNQTLNNNLNNVTTTMDVDDSCSSKQSTSNINLPTRSFIISSKDSDDIHNDNVKLLSAISEENILEEQKKLLSTLDPKLVEFLKSKRLHPKSTSDTKFKQDLVSKDKHITEVTDKMDTSIPRTGTDNLWENDVLSHPGINKWLHFDSLEKDKLEWMKGIEESKMVNADEPYEARFDFKGYLLPYTIEYNEKTKPLFHHGDEPHRPGYSIAELIELSRSSITQQRVMALNTIAGIMEYHSVGTYKNVIDIPISKLFFVVRIAMDENKIAILEPALKAMRNLLFNRIDEASLDSLIGFEEGTMQPCLEIDNSEFEELQSNESEFTDYHLAEIDLIKALQRTDILQRLYYILETVRPNFNCVQYSLQILTRIARDSADTALKIVETDHLMMTVMKNFVPVSSTNFVFDPNNVYNGRPVLAAIKLMRILSNQTEVEVTKILVSKYEIVKSISEYISSGVERTYGLKIQIEAYCTLSNLMCSGLGAHVAISLFPVIITALHKHVKGTDINVESTVLTVTHATVVLQLVNRILLCIMNGMDSYKSQIYPLLKEGFQKWIGQLSNANSYTSGNLRLLCSALDCCKTVTLIENLPVKFLIDSLRNLCQSEGLKIMMRNVIPCSNLLSGIENKDLHLTKNLRSLGSCVLDSYQKVLPVLNIASPIPFLTSLFNLLTYVNDKELCETYLAHLSTYLLKIRNSKLSLCDNWFTRMEANLLFNIIKLSTQCDVSEVSKELLYSVANKLSYILRKDKRSELGFLFNYVIFNKRWFTAERLLNILNLTDNDGFSISAVSSLQEIKFSYNNFVSGIERNLRKFQFKYIWQLPILPRDWIYLPILTLYSRSQENIDAPEIEKYNPSEKGYIISCSLKWILFNELCFPDILSDIDTTDKFCRIMCVFLCDNSLFLDAKIQILLKKCIEIIFKNKSRINFDKPLVGLNNFQDFYTQFLEQFQSVSYGDATFAACVLVPLAQRHDIKWRKLLWSEYAGCLRALDCPEELLCYDINEYLYPEETDESLIKSYFQALSTKLLRPDTVAHKIASHHTECYKKRVSSN